MLRAALVLCAALGAISCAADRRDAGALDLAADDLGAPVGAGGEPVVGRLRTRDGVTDLTVSSVAGRIGGIDADTMRAQVIRADADPSLVRARAERQAGAPDLAAPPAY